MKSRTGPTGIRGTSRALALFRVAAGVVAFVLAALVPGCAAAPAAVEPPKPLVTPKPFVTWDQDTVVPFMCYDMGEPGSESFRGYLGLWNLVDGTVSFADTPLLEVNRAAGFPVWDGGNRFVSGDGGAKALDTRIRVDAVQRRGVLAAPSGSDATFAAYREEGTPVLEVRNHALAGKVAMVLPELPPGTEITREVGIEVGQDKVTVYFETLRFDEDTAPGTLNL